MKVLIIGSGSKEHVLTWKLWCSEKYRDTEIVLVPGNLALAGSVECLDIKIDDIDRIVDIAIARKVNLVIIGEAILFSQGIVDKLQAEGIKVVGPTKVAAQIEWSQHFAKQLMIENQIPCAKFVSLSGLAMAQAYLLTAKFPLRIRSDLQFEKNFNSTIVNNKEQALAILQKLFKKKLFSKIEPTIILEEVVEGYEFTINVIADGKRALSLVPVQSYRDDGSDMGAYGPSSMIDLRILSTIRESIINPTIDVLAKMGRAYSGFLAFDIVLDRNDNFNPKLIQYRTTLLDSDAQVVLPLLDEDLFELLTASATGDLSLYEAGLHRFLGSALSVNVHANDRLYDLPPEVQTIELLHDLNNQLNIMRANLDAVPIIFYGKKRQSGSKNSEDEVFGATAVASNLVDAQILAYKIADSIALPSKYYLKDIGDQGML